MTREPVESKLIAAIGWEDDVLQVEFRHKTKNPVYNYLDFPKETHAALMAAPSKGKFFLREIKPKYRYEKVPSETEAANQVPEN